MAVSPVHAASRDLKRWYRMRAVMNKNADVADKVGIAVTNYHFEALKMIELFGAPAAEAYASGETVAATILCQCFADIIFLPFPRAWTKHKSCSMPQVSFYKFINRLPR